jgi:polysaccharide biosynthesis transport protein
VEHIHSEPQNDLREYLRILRARKWSIILVTGLVVASAAFFSARQTPRYTASAQVLVRPFQTSPTQAVQDLDLITEQALVSTPVVAVRAATILGGGQSPQDLLGGLSVAPVSTSQILQISYESTDPVFAAKAANAFAGGYIRYKRDQFLGQIRASLADVQRRISATEQSLTEVEGKLASARDPARKAAFSAQRDSLLAHLGVLQDQLDTLQAFTVGQQGGGELVKAATTPSAPSSPKVLRDAILALVVGLALGVGFGFLRERLDDSIRTRAELERRLGVPILAAVPRVPGWRRRDEERLVTLDDPKSPASESYRTLRTNLQFVASQRDMQIVIVTSAIPGEGKSATAANLAVAMAQAGRRVVLISADLRRPRVHKYLGVSNDTGLSLVLADATPIWTAAKDPRIENLRVVPSGPVPPNPAELLESDRLPEVLKQLRESAEVILIDTPPVLAVADASIVAAHADGVLFVVDADMASRAATSQAREQLHNAGAHLVGAVFNNYDPAQAGAYPYYYNYYYTDPASEQDGDGDGDGSSPEASRRGRTATTLRSFRKSRGDRARNTTGF